MGQPRYWVTTTQQFPTHSEKQFDFLQEKKRFQNSVSTQILYTLISNVQYIPQN